MLATQCSALFLGEGQAPDSVQHQIKHIETASRKERWGGMHQDLKTSTWPNACINFFRLFPFHIPIFAKHMPLFAERPLCTLNNWYFSLFFIFDIFKNQADNIFGYLRQYKYAKKAKTVILFWPFLPYPQSNDSWPQDTSDLNGILLHTKNQINIECNEITANSQWKH